MPFLMSFFTIINCLRLALPGKQQLCKTPSTGSGPQRYCSHFWQAESLDNIASKPVLAKNPTLSSPWPALATEWPHGDGLSAGEIKCAQKEKN